MARQPRIEYPGARYHILARGNRREDIFRGDGDRELFLETMEEACGRAGWQVHAWVLMGNHFHWVLKTPEANLSEGMKWFMNTYTRRFNARNKFGGHLFGGRYKSILVDDGIYFKTLVDYIHLNPVRAGLVKTSTAEDLLKYRWSSLVQGYVLSPGKRKRWLEVGERLGVSDEKETVQDRRRYLSQLHRIAQQEGKNAGRSRPGSQAGPGALSSGWYWGSEEFKERMIELSRRINYQNKNYCYSPLTRDRVRFEAEELIAGALKSSGMSEEQMLKLKSGDPLKVALVVALRRLTTSGNIWIAERLRLKSAGNVSRIYGHYRKGEIRLNKDMKQWLKNVENA